MYSLRDKHAGKAPDDVRVAEDSKVVKQRLANMESKKKKNRPAKRRAGTKINSKETK